MPEGEFYLAGGSGYTLSRKALKAYVEGPLQTCNPNNEGSAEDLFLTQCAREYMTKRFIYTGDIDGSQRYHQGPVYAPIKYGIFRQALKHIDRLPRNVTGLPEGVNQVVEDGPGAVSSSSITFHKHYSPNELRRLELLLYKNVTQECLPFVNNNKRSQKATSTPDTDDEEKNPITVCQSADPTVEQKFLGYPQEIQFGRFRHETGKPFITQDCWADIVDNKRTFYIRTHEANSPTPEMLRDWIRSRPHPITLVINNQKDRSWPDDLSNQTAYEMILNEPKLHQVFAANARRFMEHPKLKPLPIGLKWNFRSTMAFSESKNGLAETYTKFGAGSPEESEQLFYSRNRTLTVYFRPMTYGSNKRTKLYTRDTPALKAIRWEIPPIVNETAKESIVFADGKMSQDVLFEQLKTHRFVISPPGNGLDTHGTWEALLCGCIPIVPRSDLDPVFENLPVWLVDSWDEVTDESLREKDEYFKNRKDLNWEKI